MSLAIGKSARKSSMSVFCQKTASISIVVAAIGDAMAAGIVHSLAKPEGNVTSLTFLNTELSAKRIELLKVALPMMQRISVFNDMHSQVSYLKETLGTCTVQYRVTDQIFPQARTCFCSIQAMMCDARSHTRQIAASCLVGLLE